MPTLHPEVRMAEMMSMGVGSKTFQDIAPNEEAINDRTINYVLKCRGIGQAMGVAVRKDVWEAMWISGSSDLCSLRTLAQVGSHLSQPDPLSYCRCPLSGLHCCGSV